MKQTTIHFTKPILLLLPLLILFAFSCANENQDAQEHDYTVTINTTVTRAAFPSVDTSLTYFFAQVVDASNPTTVLSTAKSTTTSISMSFSSYASLMTLTVYGYDSDTVLNTAAASTSPGDTALFCGTVNNLTSSTLAAGTVSVTLSPVKTTGTGTISLPIQFPASPTYSSISESSFTIASVKATLKNVATATSYTKTFSSSDFSTSSGTATITISSLYDSSNNTEVTNFPSGSYSLTLEFYKEGNSTTPVRTFFDFLNIWSNMKTTEWQSSSNGKLSSSALILKDEDFSYSYAKPASVTLEYYSSASTVTPTLYTNAARSTSSSFDPTTTTTDYYLSNTTLGGQNLSLTVKPAMLGQSFTVTNEVSIYNSEATQTKHNEPISFVYSSTGLLGLVPLYAGTNTVTVTCTGRDGTTKETYTFSLLNPYYYVSTQGKDSFSDDNKTLTYGGGSSSLPLLTIQQAVYSITAENNARRTQNSSDTTNYTIYLNGTISTVNNTDTSLSSYYSMVSIVSTDKSLNITIAGKNGNNTLDGIDVSKYNKNATTKVRGLMACGKSGSSSSSDINSLSLTFKDLFIRGGYISSSTFISPATTDTIQPEGGGVLLLYTNATFTNCIIGQSVDDYTYTLSNSNYAARGGGIALNYYSNATFDSTSLIYHNYTDSNNTYGGGGISLFCNSNINLNGTKVSYNMAKHGGGITANSGTVTCSDSSSTSTSISNNEATLNGGGLYLVESTTGKAILNGSTKVSSNKVNGTSEAYGAGVYITNGNLTINGNSSITCNTLTTSSSSTKLFGAGIYIGNANGSVTMNGGTIGGSSSDANTGAYAGGGLYIANGTATIASGVISHNTLVNGTMGPQLYLDYPSTCTFTGKPTIANAIGSTLDNTIGIVSGTTIGIGAQLSPKQTTETAYIIKPLDISNSPSYTNRSILTVPSAYTSTVTLTDDVVSNFALTPQTVTINSTSQELTWKIASTTTSPGIITAGFMYYPILNKTIIDAATWKLAIASMIVKGEYTFTFGDSTSTTVDLTSLTSTDGMDIKDGYSVTAVAGADIVTVKLPQNFTPFVVESGGTLNLTTSSDTNFLTLTGNNSVRSKPLISTSGTLNLNTALSIDGYTDYSSTDSSILTGEQTSSAAVVIGSNGKCTMNGATIYNSATNSETSGYCGRAFYLSDSTSSLTISSGSIYNLFANYGAAIYTKNGTVTINDGVIGTVSTTSGALSLKAYQDGGAIYMNDGSLNIKGGSFGDNSTNQNIAANGNGGSIYMKSGTITMSGGTLKYSKAVSGGALYMEDGTFTMSGGTIVNNTATASGGAVYIADGTFTMSGGTIGDSTKTTYSSTTNYSNLASEGAGIYFAGGTGEIKGTASIVYNTAYVSGGSENNGGGLYIATAATVSFADTATIKYNCSGNGSGIYLNGGTFTATGGTIVNNYIWGTGNGQSIYLKDGTVDMSGNTVLNQIYLCTDKYIVISGALTTTESSAAIIDIKATPAAGIQIVKGKSYTLTSSDIAKIKYNGTGFTIGSDGTLQ